jgi:hypothetical protein
MLLITLFVVWCPEKKSAIHQFLFSALERKRDEKALENRSKK